MSLFQQHKSILDNAIKANSERAFFAQYPEHPKAYGEEAPKKGQEAYQKQLGSKFSGIYAEGAEKWLGEEESPYTQEKLGISYPAFAPEQLVKNAREAGRKWRKVSIEDRMGILLESLERLKERFFEVGFATMHTTGQSQMMSFQASGPHAADRALEALAIAYEELTRYPQETDWEKPMGKMSVKLKKQWHAIPRGTGLLIGCSTFPVWNTIPGLYADLITGNPAIVKPHPGAIYPIAIVVACIQEVLREQGLPETICQLAPDTAAKPITKELAEHPDVKLIDYTGGPSFGNYVESLQNKITFTEKAGVNSVILDSVDDLKPVFQNLSFAISLYSGQMCTAPQNIFIPETGVKTAEGTVPYEEVVEHLTKAIEGLVNHPKMGAGTLGAIQNAKTHERAQKVKELGGKVLRESAVVENPEFKNARIATPAVVEVDATQKDLFSEEHFGPIVLVVKTQSTEHSAELASDLAREKGAISCGAWTTDQETKQLILEKMEEAYTPVSFNLVGPIWMNQNAAFSDFHVTGGNPAGNASFTNPEFINKRFVWVGHREVVQE